jgi:hypothetical protein
LNGGIDKSMEIIRLRVGHISTAKGEGRERQGTYFVAKFTPSVAVRVMLACGILRQDAQCKIACLLERLGQLRCPKIVFWRGTTLALIVLPLL